MCVCRQKVSYPDRKEDWYSKDIEDLKKLRQYNTFVVVISGSVGLTCTNALTRQGSQSDKKLSDHVISRSPVAKVGSLVTVFHWGRQWGGGTAFPERRWPCLWKASLVLKGLGPTPSPFGSQGLGKNTLLIFLSLFIRGSHAVIVINESTCPWLAFWNKCCFV